jgi:predicted DNA-binding transcriptional regulator AlpA
MQSNPTVEPLLQMPQLAEILHKSVTAIKVARVRAPHTLPPAVKIGTRVYWRPQTVREWLAEHEEAQP